MRSFERKVEGAQDAEKGISEAKILSALRQVEGFKRSGCLPRDERVAADLLHLETSKRRTGISELRELRRLREENRKLKGLVADLTLDKQILQDVKKV